MKKLIWILLLVVIVFIIGVIVVNHLEAKPFVASQHPQKQSSQHHQKEQNVRKISRKLPGDLIRHTYYQLGYSEKYEQALWVKYTLTKKHVGGSEPRSAKFYPDPMVKTGSANDADYRKSGYDRGHLVPAADMSWNPKAMKESFYYSNMSPQVPSFNRGIWKKLEEQVRDWAVEYDSVMVMAGPLFAHNEGAIGKDSVVVPSQYYKVLIVSANGHAEGIGFVFPNKKTDQPLSYFTKPIDEVEMLAGIDFFSELPDNVEVDAEQGLNQSVWRE